MVRSPIFVSMSVFCEIMLSMRSQRVLSLSVVIHYCLKATGKESVALVNC